MALDRVPARPAELLRPGPAVPALLAQDPGPALQIVARQAQRVVHLVADVLGQVLRHPVANLGSEGEFFRGEVQIHRLSPGLGALRCFSTVVRFRLVPAATRRSASLGIMRHDGFQCGRLDRPRRDAGALAARHRGAARRRADRLLGRAVLRLHLVRAADAGLDRLEQARADGRLQRRAHRLGPLQLRGRRGHRPRPGPLGAEPRRGAGRHRLPALVARRQPGRALCRVDAARRVDGDDALRAGVLGADEALSAPLRARHHGAHAGRPASPARCRFRPCCGWSRRSTGAARWR